jgi:nitroreductase
MNVWDAIQTKRAVRHFTDQPLSDEALERILNAGRRSQSSKNTQPWHFVVVRERATLEALAQTGDYLWPVARAAACIALVTPDVPAGEANWIAFDIGQVAAYMQLAAQEIGVGSVIGAVFQPDKVRDLLGLPDDRRVDVVLSFGYPTEHAQRPLQGQGRRPLADIVRWERWSSD